MVTPPKPAAELTGLVYGFTPIPKEENVPLVHKPIFWAGVALGPAAEILRQWGDRIDQIRPTIAADIRGVLAQFVTEDGSVRGPGSVWVVSGRKPA